MALTQEQLIAMAVIGSSYLSDSATREKRLQEIVLALPGPVQDALYDFTKTKYATLKQEEADAKRQEAEDIEKTIQELP